MWCSQCGNDPKVVIADGVSISFPSHHRTETLRPPTVSDKNHSWIKLRKTATKLTGFSGPKSHRLNIHNSLNISNLEERLRKLDSEIESLRNISVFLHYYYTDIIREITIKITVPISIVYASIIYSKVTRKPGV